MMGCDYFPFFSWMGGGFAGVVLSLLLWGLIIFLIVFFAVKLFAALRAGKTGQLRDQDDSLEILEIRYARGEIDQQQYVKMKDILLQSK